MIDYILSCCSAADLTEDFLKEHGIRHICFHSELDGEIFPDDMGRTISPADFYQRMKEGALTRTSQINTEEYIRYFESLLEEGKDVVHVTLSSGISGTYNSALLAKRELADSYPDQKLYIIDSLGASSGYGLLMDQMAKKKAEGMSAVELAEWAAENRLNARHWFFSTTLEYFVRGGRISKTAGAIGGMLNICPLMDVDEEGKLEVREKIRTKKRVIKEIVKKMTESAEGGTDYDGCVFLSHSACEEDARAVADLVEQTFPKLKEPVHIFDIGTLIGSHTGPGTVALFYWGSKRSKNG